MGKNRDYTRYSKGSVEPTESKVPANPIETIMEPIQPMEAEYENATETIQNVEVKSEVVAEEKWIEESKFVTGVVTDCIKLNVREEPTPTATILGTITASTELIIIEEGSTADFYKICTSAGLEGYCMKKFVTIIP